MNDPQVADPKSLRPAGDFTQAMKDRLAMRLLMRPDRSDGGETLPATAKALELPSSTPEEGATRVQQLVQALAEERLIVPVTVEASPDDPGHKPLDPAKSPLQAVDSPFGASVVAFTSVDDLKRWDPSGRPMAMKSYRVAVGALAGGGSGTLTVNPASPSRTVVPRQAVEALAAGDEWLPAWGDTELKEQLKTLAADACPAIVAVGLRPAKAYGSAAWDGAVAVDLFIDPALALRAAGGDESKASAMLGAAMKAVADSPRLKQASQSIELTPRPVSQA